MAGWSRSPEDGAASLRPGGRDGLAGDGARDGHADGGLAGRRRSGPGRRSVGRPRSSRATPGPCSTAEQEDHDVSRHRFDHALAGRRRAGVGEGRAGRLRSDVQRPCRALRLRRCHRGCLGSDDPARRQDRGRGRDGELRRRLEPGRSGLGAGALQHRRLPRHLVRRRRQADRPPPPHQRRRRGPGRRQDRGGGAGRRRGRATADGDRSLPPGRLAGRHVRRGRHGGSELRGSIGIRLLGDDPGRRQDRRCWNQRRRGPIKHRARPLPAGWLLGQLVLRRWEGDDRPERLRLRVRRRAPGRRQGRRRPR